MTGVWTYVTRLEKGTVQLAWNSIKKTHSWNVINYQGLIIPFEVSEAEYNIQILLEKFQFVTL